MDNSTKIIFVIALIINLSQAFGQKPDTVHFGAYETDSTNFRLICQANKLVYAIPGEYEDMVLYGACINVKDDVSCLNRCFAARLRSKKTDYIIGIQFQKITSLEAEAKTRKLFDSTYDRNKNYLGKNMCLNERTKGLLKILSANDMQKMEADSVICFKGMSNTFSPYLGKYDNRIAVIMHKKNRGDITVQYLYRNEDEIIILKEITKIAEIIRFDQDH